MHNLKKYTDQELADIISKSKRKREKAFGELYFRYENKLYNHIRFMCKNKDVSDDITQQTWIQMYNTILKGCTLTNTYGFLLKISQNLFKNHLRSQKPHIDWDSITSSESGEYKELIDDFEIRMDKQELSNIVQFSLDIIDNRDREVIVYKKVDGLTYKEIAELYNISYNGAKKRYEKAIGNLNKVIDPYLNDFFN